MKLRIRSLDSKETLKIQAPSPCSLHDLKTTIADKISSLPHQSIHLSLNRKDELEAPPNQSLQSLGLTSGDLIFYSLNPNSFSPQTLIHQIHPTIPHPEENPCGQEKTLTLIPNPIQEAPNPEVTQKVQGEKTLTPIPNPIQEAPNPELTQKVQGEKTLTLTLNPMQEDMDFEAEKALTLTPNSMKRNPNSEEETLDSPEEIDENPEDMDLDGCLVMLRSSTVPCFLKKVLNLEAGNAVGDNCRRLIIAVHAVFLESGFVGLNPLTGRVIEDFCLPDGWASMAAKALSIQYTIPDLVTSDDHVAQNIVLKFQVIGKVVAVYGSLSGKGLGVYRLSLDASRFVPSIDFVWQNSESDEMIEKDGNSESIHEREVFELWKIVKDGLSLPLLIGLCENTGLPPPPCFMRLPTDLKIKTLEFLPGIDIGKMACVCSELKYMSSNDDLWKQKFMEEFGRSDEEGKKGGHWKEKFAISMAKKKMWRAPVRRREFPFGLRYFPARRGPAVPFRLPPRVPVIGGDYDLFPAIGAPVPFGTGGGAVPFGTGVDFPLSRARRTFSPHCNLGGFDV
ncbi:F-box protein SKIP22-like [Tasmannia lanceolata]|uniref:F-box protein SKIP22-like n=1 Tax=Tasmannia lanceolata TaxID=3420 RepID=UPI0040637454